MKEIKKCLWCNTELIGKKLDAIYCNNKCSYLKRKSDNPNINYKIYECDVLEKYYIKEYKESGIRLLNLTEGGEGSYGYKHTEESKKKMSSIRKNFLDDKQCEILRQQGLKQWEMTSDEEKLNNILNQKGRRNVYQYDIDGNQINEFLSVRQIERDLGYFRASISSCLKGISKQAYGYIWKYE